MASTETRIALIGSGFIADVHLMALRRMPGVRVTALCDTVRPRAERLGIDPLLHDHPTQAEADREERDA